MTKTTAPDSTARSCPQRRPGSNPAPIWIALAVTLSSATACKEDAPPEDAGFELVVPAFTEVESRGFSPKRHFEADALSKLGALAPLLELTGGIAVADVDGDGDDDMLVLGGDEGAQLFINDDGEFEEMAEGFELTDVPRFATGPLLSDVDGDQDPDLVFAELVSGRVEVWRNDDGERFEKMDTALDSDAFAPAVGVATGDVDNDGDLDLFVARWSVAQAHDPTAGVLWLNDGDGEFEDRSDALPELEAGSSCDTSLWGVLSPTFADVLGAEVEDGLVQPGFDHHPELLLARHPGPNQLFVNTTAETGELSFELFDFAEEYRLRVDQSPPPDWSQVKKEDKTGATHRTWVERAWAATQAGALSSIVADLDNNALADWVLIGADKLVTPADCESPAPLPWLAADTTTSEEDSSPETGDDSPSGDNEQNEATDASEQDEAPDASVTGSPEPALDSSGAGTTRDSGQFDAESASADLILDGGVPMDAASASTEPDAATFPTTFEEHDGGLSHTLRRWLIKLDDGTEALEQQWLALTFQPESPGDAGMKPPRAPVLTPTPSPAVNACAADFNNDRLLDVLQVTATDVGGSARAHLQLGSVNSPRGFVEAAVKARIADEGKGRWVTCYDYDYDGDVDVFLMNADGGKLYENQLHRFQEPDELVGAKGHTNFLGVRVDPSDDLPLPNGTRVTVQWLNPESRIVTLSQELHDNASLGSQTSRYVHFGLGDVVELYRVFIYWPDGATTTQWNNVGVNDIVRIRRTASE